MDTKIFIQHFELLSKSKYPEQIFGDSATDDTIDKEHKRISKIVHPDVWASDAAILKQAEEAFKLLEQFKIKAKEKVKYKTYGDLGAINAAVTITTKKNEYKLTKIVSEGDIATIFLAQNKDKEQVVLKIVRNARNNDLIQSEQETLNFLYNNSETNSLPVMQHIGPKFIDNFEYSDKGVQKNVLAFPYLPNLYTLEDVINKYPNGIDLRDAAWMLNRLLAALMIPQQANVVHGAVVPNNFLIDPKTHNGILIDWAFSVKTNEKLTAISSKYKNYYPSEVFDKNSVNSGADVYMAAKIFLKLIGGNIERNEFPTTTPKSIQGLFRACYLGAKHRTMDPFELHKDFSEELEKLYGKRKFREFVL
jgi:serine/threonine protein kinase